MAEQLSPQEKLALIKENLQEVLKPEILEDVIVKQNRPLVIYWGTSMRLSSRIPSDGLDRHCDNRTTALWLLCPDL